MKTGTTRNKPEWAPADSGNEFASNVVPGVIDNHDGRSSQSVQNTAKWRPKRSQLTIDDYVEGVLRGDRVVLARAITLIESNSLAHINTAQEVLKKLLPHTGNSIRIGITGVPGVGKSTFIEALGVPLCQQDHHVAVLAVDPSSSRTKGSILGDKTRMEKLSREPNCFIRPSPSGGTLGGVTRKSRETILVCEAAGFDVILVETVGVGQSETTVRSMVDFFLLLMLSGAGDELQGIKKGVMELADALLINKADGDNKMKAEAAKNEYNRALHYLLPATEGWTTTAYTCSSLTGAGITAIWEVISEFRYQTERSGVFGNRRKQQKLEWMRAMIDEHLTTQFYSSPSVRENLPVIEKAVLDETLPPTSAVKELLEKFTTGK